MTRLWDAAPASIFIADRRPEYLNRILRPEAPKAAAVKLRMRGEIRLKRWKPFTAEEVIDSRRGFVWRARVGALSGCDALVDGKVRSRWNLLGALPVLRSSGPDVRRSAIGRWLVESCWLPTMWRPDEGATWEGPSVTLERLGETGRIDLSFDRHDRLTEIRTNRWGNPGGGPYAHHSFGALVEETRSFGGFVIPSRVRGGWHIGTSSWDEGEFFRATIVEAAFR